MAPSLSFVKINNKYAVPIRVHINRKRILLKGSLFQSTISSSQSKSIVVLKKINNIRLSNRDLTSLIETIQDDLINILLKESIAKLRSQSLSNAIPNLPQSSICINIAKPQWKCHLVTSFKFILALRERLGSVLSLEDQSFLEKLPSNKHSRSMCLVTKKSVQILNEPQVLIEENSDDELRITEDISTTEPQENKKMSISYTYSSPRLFNEFGSLSLYVYDRSYK